MKPISRRSTLRFLAGTTGVVGASVIPGAGLLDPASAATGKKIHARLNRATFSSGQRMVLEVRHHALRPGFTVHVTDAHGLEWKRIHGSSHPQRWTATAAAPGEGSVTAKVVRPDGRVVHDPDYHVRLHYTVHGLRGMRGPLVGMGAQKNWAQRLSEVGPGVAARRIFADLSVGATSQIKLVEEAHRAGMLPVISYAVGGDVAGAVNGKFNAVARQAAAKLASYDLPTAVVFWHEPYGDMSGSDYAAASRQLLPIFKRGKLRVGPLLNGWLLDRKVDTFASFCPDDLFHLWDWVGMDTYQSGTAASPGDVMPAGRIPALRKFVASRGHRHMPLGVGEYNGWTAAAIKGAGDALFTTPNVWFGCVWNNTGGIGEVLAGDRLTAFRQTLADPRSKRPRAVTSRAGSHLADLG